MTIDFIHTKLQGIHIPSNDAGVMNGRRWMCSCPDPMSRCVSSLLQHVLKIFKWHGRDAMRLFVNQNKMVCCVHLDFDMWLLFCCLQLKGGPVHSWLVGSSWWQKSYAQPLCTSYDLAWITFDFISSFQCHMTQETALTYGNNAHELGMNTYIHDDLHPLPGWFGVHLCLRSMGWKSSLVAK